MHSVKRFVEHFKSLELPLHVLINNAGVMGVDHSLTPEGVETHFATNYLGHVLLTTLLLPMMNETATQAGAGAIGRVVHVSCQTHYFLYAVRAHTFLCVLSVCSSCPYLPVRAFLRRYCASCAK